MHPSVKFASLRRWATSEEGRAWLLVLGVYLAVFGGMLIRTDGFPYTIDNNESFSSLVHAQNMAKFDFGRSYGLTDESYALTEGGHPYIHSHQGNFPRIFAFLLYLVGARSIESQIWLTTFTVGLAAIILAFRFARRVGGPWLAVAVCLILITDYVLFAQWHVNTYRVWHAFFFFSSLECVHLVASHHRWRGWLLAVANFAGLFYWEYVFGAFVGLCTAIYALIVHRKAWRRVWQSWATVVAGGMIAAGTLLAQLTAYMGWENVLRDVRYTLLARNSASDSALAAEINAFYDHHNILFWQNYVDAGPLKSGAAAMHGLIRYHIQYSSPVLFLAAAGLVIAMILSSPPLLGGIAPARCKVLRWWQVWRPWVNLFLLTFAVAALLRAVQTLTGTGWWPGTIPPGHWLTLVVSAGFAFALSVIWTRETTGFQRLPLLRIAAAWASAEFCRWAAGAMAPSLDMSVNVPVWQAHGWLTGSFLGTWVLAGTGCIGFAMIILGPAQVLGRTRSRQLLQLLPLILAVAVAFAVTYRIFTGYIYSGYLYRQTPFLVFASDFVLGAGLFIIACATRQLAWRHRGDLATVRANLGYLPSLWRRVRDHKRRAMLERHSVRAIPVALTLVPLLAMSFAWVSTQWLFFKKVPPTNYRFLAKLKEPPFKGASFAVNTYAAPVAMTTGSWAYFESTLFSGALRLGAHGWQVPHDHQYLWFADRGSNLAAYLQPDYALTIVQPAGVQESLARDPNVEKGNAAETTNLFKRASACVQPFLHHRVVASDKSHFSIVKFDWDFPAFLAPMDGGLRATVGKLTLPEKFALSAASQSLRLRWRIELTPVSLPRSPATKGEVRISEATSGALSLFSSRELENAGWKSVRLARDQPAEWHAGSEARTLQKVVSADKLRFAFPTSKEGGLLHVSINDLEEWVDLRDASGVAKTLEISTANPHGLHTRVPNFTPGVYVTTALERTSAGPAAVLNYQYKNQVARPEANTVLRLYQEDERTGTWRLLETMACLGRDGPMVSLEKFRSENPDTVAEHARVVAAGDRRNFIQWLADHLANFPDDRRRRGVVRGESVAHESDGVVIRRVPLQVTGTGRLQLSVAPGTLTKSGPEYCGLPFAANQIPKSTTRVPMPVRADLTTKEENAPFPYGKIKMKVQFPTGRVPQAEPLVSSGVEQAGDFIYVVYADNDHIRLGFDHWIKGGPLSPPIRIDFEKEHELEISMGSLFPHAEDIVFADEPLAVVEALKNNVVVKLNGETIIDTAAECYESPPGQVKVGYNLINGTSSNPEFTGKILSIERIWPELESPAATPTP
jgi:hypothetical protein